ncbi:YdcF family protein [Aestuariibacter halophilus]|uniref:YdcF family protein n=1 Tax=Fluctibacter halophilus TaxID=226011 RepID=A0ABS8G5Y7_9ALTE|nr:ElyC/SanA/YdcF family protein [Aestuariibacter halophilus]MCC2615516.1 YdcF family protein [Aestuariibacter halophilus]
MDGFLVKKLLGNMLMPMSLITVLLLCGSIALIFGRIRLARWTCIGGTLLLLIVATPFVAEPMLGDLEHQYPQYDISKPASTIVILGCGHTNDGTLPITAQLKPCSTIRAVEALRIWQHNPTAKLITSGAAIKQPFSNAFMTRELLIALGIPEHHIEMMESPRDTEEEAQALASLLPDGQPFVLVTSASHMARSVTLMQRYGLTPMPAPTEHLIRQGIDSDWQSSLPSANHIKHFERWWYETLGNAWIQLKTWF